ncbi:MAG: hypothetical protein MUF06_24885, partial [Pirellulaceae bacterium]|nr:hypothetical protein [Pirellulaceae bacterium]
KVERSGATFAISQEFSLLASDDKRFHPAAIAEQADGSLLVATGPAADDLTSQGSLYELTWIGTNDLPLAAREDAEKSAPPPDRQAQLALAGRATEPAPLRARAIFAAAQSWDQAAQDTCQALVAGEDIEMARLAAELLADHLPTDKPVQESLAAILQDRLLSAPPAVQRSLYLTLGKLGQKLDTVPRVARGVRNGADARQPRSGPGRPQSRASRAIPAEAIRRRDRRGNANPRVSKFRRAADQGRGRLFQQAR